MSVSTNAEELAAVTRRYRSLNRWFYFFLLLIPLGVIAPCLISVVAYKLVGDRVSAPIALSALLWPLVGVAGALLLRGARKRARRTLELTKLADSFGLRFSRVPAAESFQGVRAASLWSGSHVQSADNLMEGTSGRWPLVALDYHYAYLWGSVTEYADQTVVMIPTGFAHLPAFAVFPISTMGKVENFFLGKRGAISFPHEPQFNTQFAVVGDDPAQIMQHVNRPLIDLLLSDRVLAIMVEAGRLLIFRRLTIIKAEDYQAFLAQAYRVAELLAGPA